MRRKEAVYKRFFFRLWHFCLGVLQSQGIPSFQEGFLRIRLVFLLGVLLAFSSAQRYTTLQALLRPEKLPPRILHQNVAYERKGEPVSLKGKSRVGTFLGEPLFVPEPSHQDGRLYLFLGGEKETLFQPYERLHTP